MSANRVISERKTTPAQEAKEWAKSHPDFRGILTVFSYTRKGRGGWGVTTRHNDFLVENGICAGERSKSLSGFNGLCETCGNLYFEPVLRNCKAADPDAGQPIPEDLKWGWYRDNTFVFDEFANVTACPGCREKYNLILGWRGYGPGPTFSEPRTWVRDHPVLCRHKKITLPNETLDIRVKVDVFAENETQTQDQEAF